MITFRDYEIAKELLIKHIDQRNDIVTAWQYGEVSQPGVSDLDIVVIISDDGKPGLCNHLSKTNLPALTLKAMAHANIIILPENSAIGAFYWDNIRCTDIRTGKAVEVPKISERHLKLAMLVDWFFERSYRMYSIKHKGCTNRQLVLGMMKSYSYSVENYFTLANSALDSEFIELKTRLLNLRNEWVNMKLPEQNTAVASLIFDFYDYAIVLHRKVFKWLATSQCYPRWTASNFPARFIFRDGNTFDFVDEFPEEIGFCDGNPVISTPRNLLHHFYKYATHPSNLAFQIKKGFNSDFINSISSSYSSKSSDYVDFLGMRIDYASSWFECLRWQQFDFGLFKFGWYLKP